MADDFQDIKEQFKQMHTDLEKLGGLGGGATRVQMKDRLRDEKGRFIKMNRGLDKLVEATQAQTKVTQEQTKETKKQAKAQAPNTAEAKDRKSVLKAMQLQLRKTQMEQGASMADVAAEHLAGGGGLMGAGKAAVGLKVAKLKHKFDPLNLVKKITGGSRLAVALSGKLMGRSEKSIRSFADLAPGMDLPTPFFGKSKGFGSPHLMGEGKGGRHGGDSTSILSKIAVTLSLMLARLTSIETIQRLSAKLTQQQVDAARDEAALTGAKKSPSRLGQIKEKVKDATTDAWNFIKGLIGNFKLGLLAAFALLGVAAKMLYDQWDKLKLSFTLLKESAVEMWEGVKTAFSDAGTWISTKATQFVDVVMDMFDAIVQGAQELLEKVSFGAYKAPTPEARQKEIETKAAAGDARAIRQLEAQRVEKVATPEQSATAVGKHADAFSAKIPDTMKTTETAEGLERGDFDAAATASLLGQAAPGGTAEQKTTTSAVSQLAAKSYGELFKDAQGNPLTPRTDDPKLAATRVPGVVREASKALGRSLSISAPAEVTPQVSSVPVSPTEVPPTAPTQGISLMSAAENQKDATLAGQIGTSGSSAAVINNVKHNTSQVTNLHQTMPNPRSGESSYLRSLDRHNAPS